MAVFRNDFGEDRVVPHLGWHLVPKGETVTVPDAEIEHWQADPRWTLIEPTTPAVAPAKPIKAPEAPKPEGTAEQ